MRTPFAVSLAVCLATGCVERRFAGPPPADSAAPPLAVTSAAPESTTSAASAAADDASTPAGERSWVDAVRLEQWADAAALIDALPEASRTRPEVRYVRARAAVGTGDGARALALLEGLDAALPLLAPDIARCRAEAQALAGPYAAAAAYFARSQSARDLVRAADAYEKAGDTQSARIAAERAVAAAARARSTRDEVAARAKRAAIETAHGNKAAAEADLRWVAAHAPGAPATEPSATEPAPAAAKPVSRGEALHARAMALFRAREYESAVKVFREAVAARSGHQPEDLHYAARALARADRDEEAVKTYREVAARYPRSPFAERSAYYAARLELQSGHLKEAAAAYTRYLATFRKGEHRDETEYERALAWISSGSPALARAAQKDLSALADRARDDRAARLRELSAVASDRAGDHAGALATFTEIAKSQPLTWAGLTARARLAAAGAPLPPLLAPGPPSGARPGLDLRLPPVPALLSSVGLDGDAESRLLSEEREAAAPYAGREEEALCGLYGLLSRAKRRYRVGINAAPGAWLLRAPSASERWAWDCVYPRPFLPGVRALEEQHGLPRGLVYAVMRQESGFDPGIVSPASAVGLMQLMPATAKQVATELSLPFDEADLVRPDVNLKLGAYYIAKLLKMFEGNVTLAAAAYNAGPRVVSRWVQGAPDGDVDLWVARIPYDETRTYVARVAQNMARYQWLEGGDDEVTELALAVPTDARAPADAY